MSVPNSKVIEINIKKSIVLHFLFIFHFFFFFRPHFLVLFFFFKVFSSKFFLINSHWFGMYIYFFPIFNLFSYHYFFYQVNCSLCLLHFLFFSLFKYHGHSLPKPPKLLLGHSIKFLTRNNFKIRVHEFSKHIQ